MVGKESVSFLAVVARFFWMIVGPLVLVLLAYNIVTTGEGWLTPLDIGYLAVLAGLVAARWLEFRCGNPQTAQGEPATPGHLRRYVIVAVALGLVVWLAVNVVANHLLVS